MTQRRSPWFDCVTEPPARSGWYEVRSQWARKVFRLHFHSDSRSWAHIPADTLLGIRPEHMRGVVWRGVLQ